MHKHLTRQVARLCFDERPCQIVGDVLAPVPMQPGHGRKQDDEYKRHGICSLLIAYDLDRGQRYLQLRDRRTKRDYAEFMHWLATTHYADVDQDPSRPRQPQHPHLWCILSHLSCGSGPCTQAASSTFTSRPNMPVGSTWSRLNSLPLLVNVPTSALILALPSSKTPWLGPNNATAMPSVSPGLLPPPMLVPSCIVTTVMSILITNQSLH